jgi:mRNA interferase MazF
VLRGNVHEFRPPRGIGHEQQGRRYGVIVQADEFLPRSCRTRRADITQRQACIVPPEFDVLGETTRVLVEQVGAVDAGRLGDLIARVSPQQQWGIDEALLTVLGLRQ